MDDERKTEECSQLEAPELMRLVFDDFEARSNFVGLFDLLYKIDRRVNPHLYTVDGQPQKL